jgi:hypothetical protein
LKLYDPLFPTNTWRLNGVGYSFLTNVEVAPNGLLLVVAIDPATFRTRYGVPAGVPIFGPYPGALQATAKPWLCNVPIIPTSTRTLGQFSSRTLTLMWFALMTERPGRRTRMVSVHRWNGSWPRLTAMIPSIGAPARADLRQDLRTLRIARPS